MGSAEKPNPGTIRVFITDASRILCKLLAEALQCYPYRFHSLAHVGNVSALPTSLTQYSLNAWDNESANRARRTKDGLTLKVMLGEAPADNPLEAPEPKEMDSRSTPQSEAATKPTIEEIASSVLIEVEEIASTVVIDDSAAEAIATLVEATEVEEIAPSLLADDGAAQASEPAVQEVAKVEEITPSIPVDDSASQATESAVQEAATIEETASSVVTGNSAVHQTAPLIQEAVEEEIFPHSSPGPFAEEEPIAKTFLSFYGLSEQPFGVTPDPAYLYLSQAHREAFTSLSQGIQDLRGFMTLVAEPGMGKTTLLNKLMEELRDSARVVFLFQTQCNSRELLRYILGELGVPHKRMDLVAMHQALNQFLFQAMLEGKRFVLIVDEAQNLQNSTLETIRLLSDFETTHAKLLQIVLAGQPQLADKLTRHHLSQLRQRIAVLANLEQLDATGTARYIEHRLGVAGSSEPVFTPDAVALIAEQSQGIPRNINNICCNALLQGYAQERKMIDTDIVERVTGKLDLGSLVRRPQQRQVARKPAPLAIVNNTQQPSFAKANQPAPGPAPEAETKVRGSLTGKLTGLVRSRPWGKDDKEFRLQVSLEREPSSDMPVAERYYCCSFYVSEEEAAAFQTGQPIRIKLEQD
jgi:general secretion pathway protein A